MIDVQRKLLLRWTGWFFLGNVLLFWLISVRYLFVTDPFSAGVLTAYGKLVILIFLMAAYIGHLALLAFIPSLFVIIVALLLPKPKLVIPCAIILAVIAALTLIGDTFAFNLYRFHLSGVIIKMVFTGHAKEIFALSSIEVLISAIIISGITLIEILWATSLWRLIKANQIPRWGLWLGTFLGLSLYFSILMVVFSASFLIAYNVQSSARFLPYYDRLIASLISGKISYIYLQRFAEGRFYQPEQAHGPLNYPLQPLHCQTTKKPLNLVLIVVDTWRFDMLNKQITPNLYKFAQSAVVFNHHYSGGNATRPGIFSLFYALPPSYWTSFLKQQRSPVFIDQLLKNNYQMGIYASAELKLPEFNQTVFTHIKDLRAETPGPTPQERDQYITQEFKQFINQTSAQKPFFSFLFYDAAHSYCRVPGSLKPLKPAAEICNRLSITNASDPTPYFNRYKNALMLVDQQIKQVLEILTARHLLDNTVVVITGDHGEEFNDNHLNFWGHAGNFTRYQAQTPLIVHWPGMKAQTFNHITSHYDVVPTLLAKILNCGTPFSAYSVGMSLFDTKNRPYLIIGSYIDFGIVESDRITTIYPAGNFEITDLQGRELPNAQLNLPVMTKVFDDLKRFNK